MIRIRSLIRLMLETRTYIWADAVFVRETPKAILIMFDGRKAWIPKAWLRRIKRNKGLCVIRARLLNIYSLTTRRAISIQLSEYQWVKKIW